MAITISTHNGSSVDLAHDLREGWRIEKENKAWAERHSGELRIDTSKEHKVLINRGTISQVYKEIFGDALKEYNEKQIASGKKDRVIKNYLSEIKAKEKSSKNAKHPIYELITQVGSMDNPVPEEDEERILMEHAKGFEERNPHLHVVCQVLHKDEKGGNHIHTAYIPVATEQKRGMKVQNSLTAALKQQGIVGDKSSVTAQMLWEKKENKALEDICNKYGYVVEHTMAGKKAEHLSVEEYQINKKISEKQNELNEIKELPLGSSIVKKGRIEQLEKTEKKYQEEKPLIEKAKKELLLAEQTRGATRRQSEKLAKERAELDRRKAEYDAEVNEEANRKVALMRDNAMRFIVSRGLLDDFLAWVQEFVEKISAKMR